MYSDMGTCDFCGGEFQMRRMFEIDGDHYCPACKEEHFQRDLEAQQEAKDQAFYYPKTEGDI